MKMVTVDPQIRGGIVGIAFATGGPECCTGPVDVVGRDEQIDVHRRPLLRMGVHPFGERHTLQHTHANLRRREPAADVFEGRSQVRLPCRLHRDSAFNIRPNRGRHEGVSHNREDDSKHAVRSRFLNERLPGFCSRRKGSDETFCLRFVLGQGAQQREQNLAWDAT